MIIKFNKIISKTLQIVFPIVLGGIILAYMYRGFKFSHVWKVVRDDMNYWWMFVSLAFGVLSHVFRGLRWKLTLAPLNEYPKGSNCVYSIFVSYAANLVIPRVGEISRCGILSKYDGVSFPKSLGTVVTERLIDSLCVLVITAVAILLQTKVFLTFFTETGTDSHVVKGILSSSDFYIILACAISVVVLLYFLIKNVSMFAKIRGIVSNIWQGIISLKNVKGMKLFIFYTIAIWASYFFQFYLSFFCFDFSSNLDILAGLVMFAVGSIAVIVPTPNGAGPWHFAIITMMVLYGVGKEDAGIFALLVHGIQTFLLILLGIYGLVALPLTNKK